MLRRLYILQKWDEIYYRHQLSPFDLWCGLVLEFLCDFFFVWMTYLLVIGVLMSSTTTVLESNALGPSVYV
jgi:hypothetical protein